jgi:hypothetical protein
MNIFTLCLIAALAPPCCSQPKIVIKDPAGRITQSVTIKPGQAIIRDNRGTITGTLSVKGSSAQYRNSRGQLAAPPKNVSDDRGENPKER